MLSQQERTHRMKDEYVGLREQGLTPKQIAHRFDLSICTVYNALQEIATANGVSRDSLLISPHSKHATYERRFQPVAPFDPSEFRKRFQAANADLIQVIETSINIITDQEAIASQIEKEEATWLLNS